MIVINLVLLATALFVVIVEGFNWFAIWDITPLIATAVFVEFLLSSGGGDWAKTAQPTRLCAVGLVLGVVVVTVYVHVNWLFGLGDAPPASSNGGIKFLFGPVYAFVGGGVGYAFAYVLGRRVEQGPELEGSPPGRVDDKEKPSGTG